MAAIRSAAIASLRIRKMRPSSALPAPATPRATVLAGLLSFLRRNPTGYQRIGKAADPINTSMIMTSVILTGLAVRFAVAAWLMAREIHVMKPTNGTTMKIQQVIMTGRPGISISGQLMASNAIDDREGGFSTLALGTRLPTVPQPGAIAGSMSGCSRFHAFVRSRCSFASAATALVASPRETNGPQGPPFRPFLLSALYRPSRCFEIFAYTDTAQPPRSDQPHLFRYSNL